MQSNIKRVKQIRKNREIKSKNGLKPYYSLSGRRALLLLRARFLCNNSKEDSCVFIYVVQASDRSLYEKRELRTRHQQQHDGALSSFSELPWPRPFPFSFIIHWMEKEKGQKQTRKHFPLNHPLSFCSLFSCISSNHLSMLCAAVVPSQKTTLSSLSFPSFYPALSFLTLAQSFPSLFILYLFFFQDIVHLISVHPSSYWSSFHGSSFLLLLLLLLLPVLLLLATTFLHLLLSLPPFLPFGPPIANKDIQLRHINMI